MSLAPTRPQVGSPPVFPPLGLGPGRRGSGIRPLCEAGGEPTRVVGAYSLPRSPFCVFVCLLESFPGPRDTCAMCHVNKPSIIRGGSGVLQMLGVGSRKCDILTPDLKPTTERAHKQERKESVCVL